MKFSPVIQYLRAVAAIMVLCYHVALHWDQADKPHYFFLSGGVDIFFIISGFVMWSLTAGTEGQAGLFLSRRLKRIVPLYWLMTTAMLVVLLITPGATLNSKFDLHHVVSSYFFIPAIHPVKGTFEPLLFPGWTLNYEMMFYGLITLALLGPMRFRLALILAPLAALMAMGLIPHSEKSLVAFYSNSLLAEFGMGCVLGALVQNGLAERAPRWVGAAMIGLAVASFFGLALVSSLARGVAWGVPATLFVGGWVFNERAHGTARLPLLQLLGDGSYAIYLSHVIVLSMLFQIARRYVGPGIAQDVAAVIATLACIGIGVLIYWIIERRIITWFKAPKLKSAAVPAE